MPCRRSIEERGPIADQQFLYMLQILNQYTWLHCWPAPTRLPCCIPPAFPSALPETGRCPATQSIFIHREGERERADGGQMCIYMSESDKKKRLVPPPLGRKRQQKLRQPPAELAGLIKIVDRISGYVSGLSPTCETQKWTTVGDISPTTSAASPSRSPSRT